MSDETIKCSNCNIDVPYNSNCPLCGKFLHGNTGDIRTPRFPTYSVRHEAVARKVIFFIFFVAGGICLFLDIIVSNFQGWSIYPLAGLVTAWVLFVRRFFVPRSFTVIVVQSVLVICIWAACIDIFGGSSYHGWPATWVMPGVAALGITMIMFSAFIKKSKFSEVGIHILTLALLNVVFIVLGAFGIIPNILLSLIVCVYSVICLFGLRFFSAKTFNEGLKKRLHL